MYVAQRAGYAVAAGYGPAPYPGLRASRAHRRTASPPVAALALATLAVCWVWDARRRPLAAALAGLVLTAQLALAGTVALPASLDGEVSLPALSWPAGLRAPAAPEWLARPDLPSLPSWSSLRAWLAARAPWAGADAPGGRTEPAPAASAAVMAAVPSLASPAAAAALEPVAQTARPPWKPSNAATAPYPDRVEAWRPVVRELMAEAWNEGRLDGYAARLDDDLVLAMIRQESAGDPNALSWAGAIGLMQVMPFTFAEMMHGSRAVTCAIDPAAMWDVRSNVRAGLRYMALAMQAHEGNLYWALASYNAGIDAVHDWRAAGLYAVPPIGGYTETANYAPAILRDYLRRRPDVTMYVPPAMHPDHVAGAIRQLRELDARRGGPRPPEVYPRCGR